MVYLDYRVKLSEGEQPGPKVIERLIGNRINEGKPCITFFHGGSGEGKSMAQLRFLEIIEDEPDLENQIIYTPHEYAQKYRNFIFNKNLKKLKTLIMVEGRVLVKKTLWSTLINQSIGDVNALSRSLKRINFSIGSQFITDVDKDTRKTINFTAYCTRPVRQKTRVYLRRIWMPSTDIEQPRMKTKTIKGLLKYPDGTIEYTQADNFVMNLPKKDLRKRFEELDYQAKAKIIKNRLDELEKVLNKDLPKASRLEKIAETMIREPGILETIMQRGRRGTFKIRKDYKNLWDLSDGDLKELQVMVQEKMIKKGLVEEAKEE